MDPVVILGGGLAGLSTAYFLEGRPWQIIEKTDRVGGLLKTSVHDGFHFDQTGHWLHMRDPAIRELVFGDWLAGNLVTIERRTAIFSRGVFTRFPYQVNTFGLPPEVIAENLIGFVEANYGEQGRELREREPRNFEEFILRYLGEGFAKNFMLPYNRKLWTVEPRELSPAWTGRFVPKPTLKEVVEGALGINRDAIGYNASFVYPREGGIESLVKALASRLEGGEVSCSCEPVAIDWKTRTLSLSDGRQLRYAELVSTIPLPKLVALLERGAGVPEAVRAAAGQLKATFVTHVGVGVSTPNRQPWHWVYLPEPEFKTFRIGSFSAVYAPLAPEGCSSFYVEYSHRGEKSLAECEHDAIGDLLRAQLIHRAEDVRFAKAAEIPHAYVLYDEAYGAAKKTILDFLEHARVLPAGRYGHWEYSSMEDAILGGRAAAQRLSASH